MAAPHTAEVVDFRTLRRDKRERDCKNELRKRGIHTRELVLMKLEVMERDLAHWHRRWQTAQFLNERMLIYLRLANERFAASETLLRIAEAEVERLRKLLG